MKNINHSLIYDQLREHPEMNIDQIIDLAILLESWYEASKVPAYQVNYMTDTEDNQEVTDARVSNLANMVEKMAFNHMEQTSTGNSYRQYQYHGNMAPNMYS